MAIVKICDICKCTLDDKGQKDYAKIEYTLYEPFCSIGIPQSIFICEDCFKKYIDMAILNKKLVDKLDTQSIDNKEGRIST